MKKLVYAILAFSPVMALAAFDASGNLQGLLDFISLAVAQLIPIMFGLAIIYFFWGLIVFLRASGDPKAQEAGRNQMIWGVIAIAVMVSVYGLVVWLQDLFGVDQLDTIDIPTVPGL